MQLLWILFLAASCALVFGCDRAIEPFDPNEKVEQPDLARIFPEGARSDGGAAPMGSAPPRASTGRSAQPEAGAAGESIRGNLVLLPEFAESVPRGSVLFLVARKPSGGPPVAVKRIPEPRFPLPFELGPDDRMIQTLPFEGPLLLTARVDGDGNASSREPGDLVGSAPSPVEPGESGITIQLDQKL